MNPSSTIGRFEISTRLVVNVRMLFLNYPSNDDLYEFFTNKNWKKVKNIHFISL